jgi:transposase
MFRPYKQDQVFLFPPSLKELVDEKHPAHVINDLIEALDLVVLKNRYGTMGQPAYHPGLMLKVILYGYTAGIFSARKLARACEENLAFQYLSGLEKPAFKTFIEFRSRHREDLREVFIQTVKLAQKLGLAKLGQVALDGTKITANTSKHKAMSYGRMKEEEKRLRDEIETLLKKSEEIDKQENRELGEDEDGYSLKDELAHRESRLKKIRAAKAALEERENREHPQEPIEDKKQISFADKEARCFTKKSDGTRYVYNGQAAVDMESQVIVENHIENSVSDAAAVELTLENMKKEIGEVPEKMVMDSGYANSGTLKSCGAHSVEPVCSPAREQTETTKVGKGKKEKVLDRLTYNAEKDQFSCCHGTIFVLEHWNEEHTRAAYASQGDVGCGCGHEQRKGKAVLYVFASHLDRRELQRIYERPENQKLYRKRKYTVEPVFGQIKFGMGFQRFLYRGTQKVKSEWNVVCSAFNLKKIAVSLLRKSTSPKGEGCYKGKHGIFHDYFSQLLRLFDIRFSFCCVSGLISLQCSTNCSSS